MTLTHKSNDKNPIFQDDLRNERNELLKETAFGRLLLINLINIKMCRIIDESSQLVVIERGSRELKLFLRDKDKVRIDNSIMILILCRFFSPNLSIHILVDKQCVNLYQMVTIYMFGRKNVCQSST